MPPFFSLKNPVKADNLKKKAKKMQQSAFFPLRNGFVYLYLMYRNKPIKI